MVANTATELEMLWNERDNRYAIRRQRGQMMRLSAEEIDSIKSYRRIEAESLPMQEAVRALTLLANWRVG